MSGKNIAVETCTLTCRTVPQAPGVVSMTPVKSQSVKCGGQSALIQQIQVAITGYTIAATGFTGGTGSGVIMASATKGSSEGQPLVLEGDESAAIVISGTIGSNPATVSDTVYVSAAGQEKVQAI